VSFPEVGFSPAARRWFESSFAEPTPVQREGWARVATGEHALLIAPTGSGKTLAAFFYAIDRLSRLAPDAEPGVRVVYVSPLKALVYDIERNLRAPLVGIERAAGAQCESFRAPRVAVRTGDTPQRDRRAQSRDPAEILVTTPESLYLILGSRQRETLRSVDTVIVDEIHALAPTKRGVHLALSLERLAASAARDPQRIGLSATARPLEDVARFLGGDRPVSIVDTSLRPRLDLEISVPVPDLTRPDLAPDVVAAPRDAADASIAGEEPSDEVSASAESRAMAGGSVLAAPLARDTEPPAPSLWPALYPKLLEAIRAHRSSILFVNSRGLCEKLAQRLNELAEEDLVRAHHGSIAHDQRREIEEALKAGTLRAIVATSSLELGIDMGAVDLVMMVESPGSVARGLQRVGRAGHRVGETSIGRIFPKHRGDLLEAAVVASGMRRGDVEPLRVPRNPLDVLAQQIVAMAALDAWDVESLHSVVRRTASYRDLSLELLHGVLDMLSGRYPSTDFAELRPRIVWDREADRIEGRRGAARLAIVSGGTIPDRGLYAVHLGSDGPRIGELDEEMVHETRAGETVTLGASTWRVSEITRDRVVVVPAPGEPGKLPFWRGEGPGRPIELGRELGAFVRELGERCGSNGRRSADRAEAERRLAEEHDLDAWAARNLVDYVVEQREATGCVPSDRAITIERFRDELGDWRLCILSPFGARVHAPWALAIEARLSGLAGFELQTLWSDDGIVLRFADAERTPGTGVLLPDPEEVEELVVSRLADSALFAAQFRENAARALLLPRRRPGARTPLWTQRLRAQNLQAVAHRFPAFPITLETYRSCLQDVFDLSGLRDLLGAIRRREVRVDDVETRSASPFARSLVFAYTATYLYQGDVPVAERRAQALSLDRHMLRELLGQEELRDLLDADVIDATEAVLQGRTEERRARHPDGLHDLLRSLGDLRADEVAERCDGDAADWLAELEAARRAVRLKVAGEERWVAVEDVALYRDALGAVPPAGLPEALLAAAPEPLEQLVLRWARQNGPFVTREVAERFALLPAQLEPVLKSLELQGRLLSGEFHPRGIQHEWCEPEVLRRLRRNTLAKLRDEVAPVDAPVLARFLAEWHGVGRRGGDARLDEVIDQLEGLPVSFAELERAILPARLASFDPRMLDERGATGQLVWIGRGALGDRDGRVALYRREHVALLCDAPDVPETAGPLHRALLEHLEQRGASFFDELVSATQSSETKPVFDALWDLVWWGLVTNDTFAPLRALGARARPSRRRGRRAPPPASAGRWSLAAPLLTSPPEPTARAHARAVMLLERYGILSRDAMSLESLSGGFSAVYPVLRAMEDAGKIRRGHFVDGFSGAQFAFVAAVDRLRATRMQPDAPQVQVLAACDPANPYGALLPWPEPSCELARPRRAAGASVALIDGDPALFLDSGAQRVWTFSPSEPERREEAIVRAARALGRAAHLARRRGLRIQSVDGEPALHSPLVDVFARAGYRRGYNALELDRFDDT
jgi:ATP-dependent Lhr-like helicase